MFEIGENVAVMISGENLIICEALENLGIFCVKIFSESRLPRAISSHPDIRFLPFSANSAFVCNGEKEIKDKLSMYTLYETKFFPKNIYPLDCLCNCLILKNTLFCNRKIADTAVLQFADKCKLDIVHVNQGYTRCSVCIVDENSIITADKGIAIAAKCIGIDVLEICEGHINLNGYSYGFIGGCAGRIGEKTILFAGSLNFHPNGQMIRKFIASKHIDVVELTDDLLTDIGGIIQLY